jgi:hypothetical protein
MESAWLRYPLGVRYPYGYGYPYLRYPRYRRLRRYGGSPYGGIRIEGAVRNAEVYVDGGYAGVVDNFDGTFQRLQLEPGTHTVEIRARSYRRSTTT